MIKADDDVASKTVRGNEANRVCEITSRTPSRHNRGLGVQAEHL